MHITKESKLRVVMLIGIFAVLIMLFGISLTTGRSASAVHDEFKEETTISDEIKVDSSESELVGVAGVIYASGSGGVDTNDGASPSTPVASMTRILDLLPDGGTVSVISPIVISSDLTVAPTSRITFVRTTGSLTASETGELISITGSTTTVSFSNITLDGANIDSTDTKYLMTLSATTSNVTFGTGCIIENSHTSGVVIVSGTANITTTDMTIRNCEGDNDTLFLSYDGSVFRESVNTHSFNFSGLKVYSNLLKNGSNIVSLYSNGIIRASSTANFENCTFDSNEFSNENGNEDHNYFMFCNTSYDSVTINNSSFTNNFAKLLENDENVIYKFFEFYCVGYQTGLFSVTNCNFINNSPVNYEDSTNESNSGCITKLTGIESTLWENCVFEKNLCGSGGYFIYVDGVVNTDIRDCRFTNNSAAHNLILLRGTNDEVTIEGCNFESNLGRCIAYQSNATTTLNIIGCDFTNGVHARTNGAGFIEFGTDATLQNFNMEGCKFTNNFTAHSTFGAAIIINIGIDNLTMSNCEFVGNVNEGDGGCIYAESYGEWEFNDCVFLNNHATGSGGAIYLNDIDIEGTPMFNVVFNGCEFGYNTAYGGGGAVSIGNPGENWSEDNAAVDTTYGMATFSSCYFHNNEVFANDDGYSLGFALFTDTYYTNVVEDCTFEYNVGGDKLIEARSLTINDTNLLYNTATDSDGWILESYSLETSGLRVVGNSTEYALIGSSEFSMNNSYFSDNYSESGLIYGWWMNELADCVIENNTTNYLVGFSDNASITNIEIKDNLVDLYAICQTSNGYLDEAEIAFDNLKITNNTITSSGNAGFGLFFAKPATGVISNSVFSGNTFNTSNTNSALAVLRTTLAGEQGLTFENCDFVGNVSGGGLFRLWGNFSSTAQTTSYYLKLSNCVLSGNVTETGMIDILATSDYQGIVNITDSVIYGNTDLNGAVIRSSEYVNLNISNTNIFSNMGAKGGAISVGNNGKLVLGGGVEFGNNIAEFGSSIYVEDGGEASISNVVLHDMTGVSGVFYAEHGGELNIIGGEIYNNTGENGSAFYYDGTGVISGVVAYNNSGTNGGVLYVGSTGSVVLDDIDFYSNSATNGGAVYVEGTVNFRSGEIRENTATNGGGVYVGESGSFAMSYTERLEITGSSASRVAVYGVVDSNTADYGGGVYIAENGSATINGGHKNGQDEDENSTIEGAGVNNNTTNYNGGGVYVSPNATLTILGGEVDGNKNTTGAEDLIVYGVGIYSEGTVIVNGGYIANNSVNTQIVYGGNISVMGANANLSVNNAYIYHGRAKYGGGLFVGTDALANVKNSLIEKNLCGDYGEGTAFYTNGLTIFDNCTFYENNGHYGMSFISYGCLADLTIKNCYLGPHYCTDHIILTNVFSDAENLAKISLVNSYIDVSTFNNSWGGYRLTFNVIFLEIDNCEFYSSPDSTQYTTKGLGIQAKEAIITNSIFNGSSTNIFMINNGSLTKTYISDCEFLNNVASGTRAPGQACITQVNSNSDSVIEIRNVYIHDNTGETGTAAIDVISVAQTIFSGEIIVTNNYLENGQYAVNFYGGSPITIRSGTKFIVDNNDGGNMHIANTIAKNLLEGDLDPESRVCIDLPSDISGEGYYVLGGKSRNYVLTSDILNNFYLSDSNYGLRFSEEQNGLVLYDKSENGELSVVVSDKVVVQEVGESYGLEDGDIEVLFSGAQYQGEYSIEYSLSGEEGTWGNESPVFRAKGEHTIFYRVSADILDEPIQGSVKIKVIGQRIYVKNLPSAKLRYGETLSRAVFGGGLVEDEKGQAVAGVWSFSEGSVVPRDTTAYYEATFTPYNEVYENSNVISVSVPVTISYGVVFYANGGFVTDEGDVNNSYTGINNLSQMIEYMSDNGSIIFTETYTVIGDISIVSNKNIDFVRYSTFKTGPMIIVDVDSSLILNGGAGSIVFEGGGALSGTSAFNGVILDNYGEVNLQTNVVFRGFVVHYETVGGDIYSPIRNREGATLRLNGAQIYGNILRSGLSTTGGIIYNEGTLYIAGGKFYSNHMDEVGYTSVRRGIGGFIYNLGSVSMSGGEIFNNRAEYGGAIYVAGGVVTLNGGSIYANQTSLGGGAIYVASGGEIILGATNIYGNFATSGENGIENAGGDIFDIDLSKVSSEMLAGIESNNYDMGLKFDEDVESAGVPSNGQDAVILGLLFTAFVLAFLCIVVVRKNKKKF